MTTAAICAIGDEILVGQITDTNSSHISGMLNSIGVKVCRICAISDNRQDIIETLESLLMKNNVVITTGGLGPTKDDITKESLKLLFGSSGYVTHSGQLEVVKRVLTARGIELFDINLNQASVPAGCEVIVNKLGTAPCMVFRFPKEKYPHKPVLYALPGVPFEAEGLLTDVKTDILAHVKGLEPIYHKTVMTFGIPESTLSKMIKDWENALPANIRLAYLPNSLTGVRLRLSIYGGSTEDEQKKSIEKRLISLRKILGDALYCERENTLQGVISEKLTSEHLTLSIAESCTGGKLASLFTQIPGASAFFAGSVTSYSNDVKKHVLKVPEQILERCGAVSSECAEAMASGVLTALDTDYALSTTGIAGPSGGSPEKPVGTVWVGVARRDRYTGKIETMSRQFRFSSNRTVNIDRFCSSALNLLRLFLSDALPRT